MIRIVTDIASDITAAQAAAMHIDLVPLITSFEDGVCPLNSESDYDEFYRRLKVCKKLPITSRPSPQCYSDIYAEAQACGDEVLVITLSSGLSGTYESALSARDMTGYDRVTVIDSQQAVMSQRLLVEHAVQLRDSGASLAEIAGEVHRLRSTVRVMGVIDTLTYLRKGGRIPAALAIMGDALGIKPVITVEDGIIQTMGKVRGRKQGIAMVYSMLETEGYDESFPVCYGFTSDRALGEKFMAETDAKYGIRTSGLYQVSGIIGTHLGTNCFGIAYIPKHRH